MNMRLSLSLMLIACCGGAFGDESAQKDKLDAIVMPLIEAEDVVGAVVGIVTPKGQHVDGYGTTTHSGNVTPAGDTIFEIGSLTKFCTGVRLAEMLERREVGLDDPAQKYLPQPVDVPLVAGNALTLRCLATHTSGLPLDPPNLRPKTMPNRFGGYTETQRSECLIAIAHKQHPTANGSERLDVAFQYSNVGAGLLGQLLQRRTEPAFGQLLVERVCQPLKMGDTRISLNKEQKRRREPGYIFSNQVDPSSSAGCFPAYGGLRSSLNDLLDLLSLHLNDSATPSAAAAAFAAKPQRPVTRLPTEQFKALRRGVLHQGFEGCWLPATGS